MFFFLFKPIQNIIKLIKITSVIVLNEENIKLRINYCKDLLQYA